MEDDAEERQPLGHRPQGGIGHAAVDAREPARKRPATPPGARTGCSRPGR
jgi:hypothetical protein